MKLTDKFEFIKGKPARNRIVLPPMDTTAANGDGKPNLFHVQHYGARAFGGVGTIIVETTAVVSEGKILKNDLGLWNDEQVKGHQDIVQISKQAGSVIGVQLNHAGAKAEMTDEIRTGVSSLYNYLSMDKFKMMTLDDLKIVEQKFVDAAHRALKAGYDFVELHAAHGYLLSELINPIANEVIKSVDILERAKTVINIIKRIHDEVKIPIGIRFSTSDHEDNGINPIDFKPLVEAIDKYIAYYNVSSGEVISKENVSKVIKELGNPLYRLPLVREFKELTNKPIVMAGNVVSRGQVEEALEAGVNGVAIGREQLINPNLVINALLKPNEIDKNLYHWNQSKYFNPTEYRILKEKLNIE